MTALESCVTALDLACRYGERPFLELQAHVLRLGGDGTLEQRARLEQVARGLFALGAAA